MKPSICFVALKSYAVLSGDSSVRHIGGAEVQQSLLARELARRGYRVSFVVLDHGQEDGIKIDGIRVFKAYQPDAGVRGLRFFYPRLTKLWAAMSRADADVYYQRTAGVETGLVARWCRSQHRTFLYAVASDSDCSAKRPPSRGILDERAFRFGLRNAHRIIVQTEHQRTELHRNCGLESRVVPSCAGDYCERSSSLGSETGRAHLLWLGRFVEVKGLSRLLDLATRCPDLMFDLVGDCHRQSSYARRIAQDAARLSNVVLHGAVAYRDVSSFYKRARAVLCTSLWEGFPSVFVEAWAHSLPVLTTIDPDGVVARNGLGIVAQDIEALVKGAVELCVDSQSYAETSRRARDYFSEKPLARRRWQSV